MVWHPTFAAFYVGKSEFRGVFIIWSKLWRLLVRTNPRVSFASTVSVFPLSDPVSPVIGSVCAPFHDRTFVLIGLDMVWFAVNPVGVCKLVFIIETENKLFLAPDIWILGIEIEIWDSDCSFRDLRLEFWILGFGWKFWILGFGWKFWILGFGWKCWILGFGIKSFENESCDFWKSSI